MRMNWGILFVLFLFQNTIITGQTAFTQEGIASFYADKFNGRTTASGEIYFHNILSAAHPSLPFGTMVKVTNLSNYKTVEVKINDRGPFINGRIIDLSKKAAEKLQFVNLGIVKVRIEVVGNTKITIPKKASSLQTLN